MAKGKGFTRHVQSTFILETKEEGGFVVPLSLWSGIMDRIRQCEDKSPIYENRGWAAVGVAVSAAFAAVGFLLSVSYSYTDTNGHEHPAWLPIIITAATVGIAIFSGLYAKTTFDYAKQHRCDRADL